MSNLLNRHQSYHTGTLGEKNTFGTVRSHVERYLSKTCIVVCDYMNFIKSFRYELYTRAKSLETTYCVINIQCSLQQCLQYNQNNNYYTDTILTDLYNRMELPNENKRWDKPLYTIHNHNNIDIQHDTAITNTINDITQYIIYGDSTLRSGLSTQLQQLADPNYVTMGNNATNTVIQEFIQKQNSGSVMIGDMLTIDNSTIQLHYTRKISIHELRRLQRTYHKMLALRPHTTQQQITASFVEYINGNM